MVIGAIIVIVIIVAAGAYLLMNNGTSSPTSTTTAVTTVMQTSTAASTASTTSVMPTTTANTNSSKSYTVNVAYNSSLGGNYLTNATGWTLYIFSSDKPNSSNSSCYGSCATFWPPFYTANLIVPSSLNASAFNTITRTGGALQLTYKGWPLYFYVGDKAAGQAKGQNINGFVAANIPV